MKRLYWRKICLRNRKILIFYLKKLIDDKEISLPFMKKMSDGASSNSLAVAAVANDGLPKLLLECGLRDEHAGCLSVSGACRPFDFLHPMYCLFTSFQMLDNQQNLLQVFGKIAKETKIHVGVPAPPDAAPILRVVVEGDVASHSIFGRHCV